VRKAFDASFFERFYETPGKAAMTPDDVRRLVGFVVHYLDYLGVPLRSVLDVGCGTGMWKAALQRYRPGIDYTGIETSDYLCTKYGWTKASISDFRSRRKYDLVVCKSVLPYLSDREAGDAIRNIARLCRGALYVEALTQEDRDARTYDPARTDENIHFRSARWYLSRLGKHFLNCGGGLLVPRHSTTVLFELEKG
jgi:SAM-dependent methyltransferase